MAAWAESNSVKEKQSFLGFVNFYKDCINRAADIAAPLYEAITEEPFHKNAKRPEAFRQLKEKGIAAPCLAHPDLFKAFVLQTEAATFAAAAVLLHDQSHGRDMAIGSFSKKLSSTKKCY